ncbi:MAG: S-ribosylhomocysteine lyase [Clostridia bacterium]|nr:S-ribosylhomocysteine lyase [Clostridia bacterium]
MNKIESFKINHLKLEPGFYISRKDGDITTFDMRFIKPYSGALLSNSEMHSFEHMFATYIRNSELSEDVIYFGPMGCQTGFYLLMRNADYCSVLSEVKDTLKKITEHRGDVFGNSEKECENCYSLNLASAKEISRKYLEILNNSVNTGAYEE